VRLDVKRSAEFNEDFDDLAMTIFCGNMEGGQVSSEKKNSFESGRGTA